MTKLEQVARALAVHQFGNPDSWEDQIPMARVAVEALRVPGDLVIRIVGSEQIWNACLAAILSEKPE